MKSRYMLVALSLTLGFSVAQAGMKQEKAKKAFETDSAPKFAQMKTECGCAPKFDVKWDQFATDDDVKVPGQGVDEVAKSLETICKDDAGKAGVCKGLKSVVVNKGTPADPKFDKKTGVLTLTREYNHGYGDATKLLEDNL